MYFELEIVTRKQLATSQSHHKEPNVITLEPTPLEKIELALQREKLRELLEVADCHNLEEVVIKDDEVLNGVECYYDWFRNPCGSFGGISARTIYLDLDGLGSPSELPESQSETPITPNEKKIAKLAMDIAKLFRIGTDGI